MHVIVEYQKELPALQVLVLSGTQKLHGYNPCSDFRIGMILVNIAATCIKLYDECREFTRYLSRFK